MTTLQVFGSPVGALRQELDRLVFAVTELENLVQKHSELEILGVDELAPAVAQEINEAASTVQRLLADTMPTSLQGLAYGIVMGAVGVYQTQNQARSAALAQQREARAREERKAEVAAAQAREDRAEAREQELLAQGDPGAYARWKQRQGIEEPTPTRRPSLTIERTDGVPDTLHIPAEQQVVRSAVQIRRG